MTKFYKVTVECTVEVPDDHEISGERGFEVDGSIYQIWSTVEKDYTLDGEDTGHAVKIVNHGDAKITEV